VRGLFQRIHASPLGGSPAVLVGLVLWNAGNYVFFLLAGRLLGPEDYGVVAALLAVTLIVLVPSGALQVGFSRRVAELGTEGRAIADALFRRTLRWTLGLGAIVAVIAFGVAMLTTRSVPPGPLALTALAIAPMGAFSLALGLLQGQHRFGAFAAGLAMLGAPRPIVFTVLALGASGVFAALGATAIAIVSATVLVIAMAFPRTGRDHPLPHSEWQTFRKRIGPVAVGLSGVAILLNVDVIVAKATLPGKTAGHFGAVAVLGKAVTLVPQAVSWVLLPRIATARANARPTGPLLGIGVISTLVAGVGTAIVAWVAGTPIVQLAFGDEYADGGPLLAPLVAVSTLTGLLMVLMNYQMGCGRDGFVWVIMSLAGLELALFAVLHGSTTTILWLEALVGCVGIVTYEALYARADGGICHSIVQTVRWWKAPTARAAT
jgi:O-antigen/teichoic acid export membrane protein